MTRKCLIGDTAERGGIVAGYSAHLLARETARHQAAVVIGAAHGGSPALDASGALDGDAEDGPVHH